MKKKNPWSKLTKKSNPYKQRGVVPPAPPRPWDAIVIGSGMGGMTTAAILAKTGARVLVLEQHYVPGGFTHTFRRKGYVWDVGVHAIGEVTLKSMPGRILHDLTNGELRWSALGESYEEMHFPDFKLEFPSHPKVFEESLIAAFPEEREGIEAYMAMVKDVSVSMRSYYLSRLLPRWASGLFDKTLASKAQRYLEQNTLEVISGLTNDPKLQTVLTAQWGYYGSVPSESSFAMQALVARHFAYGGYYPEGGSGSIAKTLLETVTDAQGWTYICADVEEIIIESGKAVGVRMSDGQTFHAPVVVSAAGALPTMTKLIPESHRDQEWIQQTTSTLRPAPAHICLYIGFKGDISELGCSGANKWFWSDWGMEGREWDFAAEMEAGEIGECPLLYVSFPSLKDPLHDPGPELRHTGEVVTFVPYDTFEPWAGTEWRKRGADYEALKEQLTQAILKQFLTRMPQLESVIDYVELSTPLSTDTFNRAARGSIYGIEPTPERFRNPWLRPKSPIPGLYLSGSDMASVGVIGAMMGGVLSAAAIRPFKVVPYLKKFF